MMSSQIAETLVNDHRTALLRDAEIYRLRRRATGAVVRTPAPAARLAGLFHRAERSPARTARPTAHA